jgi:multidrug transporter EmrE-like cation transporter
MTPTLWSVLGGALAILGEYLYRSYPGTSWLSNAWMWVPLTCAVSLCVYHIVNTPGQTLLSAFIIWTATTIVLRTLVCVFLLHDTVTPGTWAAMGLLVIARITQQVWK